FLQMVQYRRNQELLYETPQALHEDGAPDRECVRHILAGVRAAGRSLLTEVEAKEVLDAYGIPVVPTFPCRTSEEAVSAARGVGYPVALKLLSTTITHKSDVGGVLLNLTDDAAVRDAFRTIETNLARHAQGSQPGGFGGVAVQPMVCDKGYELIVGS